MKSIHKERFFARVNKIPGGCWEWTGPLEPSGYARCWGGTKERAHRFSWMIYNGPIPEGMLVLHKCDNKKCVNPDHLFLGTQLDNMRDKVEKGRHVSLSLPKMKDGEIRLATKLVLAGVRRALVAKMFKVHRNTIYNVTIMEVNNAKH